ncbi:Uncharacterised protein [Raoultella terrigena]|uniref:Uncharacterized protein n=1 Tax=Raoultella terrigena TaxID=577 RepID=A0A3P8KE69_RAOTE|nr:Uncharacterised protein [Raoultella terrigena]
MKLITSVVASLVIGTLSFWRICGERDSKDEVASMNLTKVGSITTSKTTSRWMRSAICRKRRMSSAVNTSW